MQPSSKLHQNASHELPSKLSILTVQGSVNYLMFLNSSSMFLARCRKGGGAGFIDISRTCGTQTAV